MKIRVDAGTIVRLDGRRTTSRTGGIYELEPTSDAHRWRVVHQEGVRVLDADDWPALAEHGLTLADARDMDDGELLALPGIGPATVQRVREAPPHGTDNDTTPETPDEE